MSGVGFRGYGMRVGGWWLGSRICCLRGLVFRLFGRLLDFSVLALFIRSIAVLQSLVVSGRDPKKVQVVDLTSPLRNSNLLPRRQLRHLHPKPTPQLPLRTLKHNLKLSRPLLTQHLGADIRAPDRQSRILARQRETHHFLDERVERGSALAGTGLFLVGHFG